MPFYTRLYIAIPWNLVNTCRLGVRRSVILVPLHFYRKKYFITQSSTLHSYRRLKHSWELGKEKKGVLCSVQYELEPESEICNRPDGVLTQVSPRKGAAGCRFLSAVKKKKGKPASNQFRWNIHSRVVGIWGLLIYTCDPLNLDLPTPN